MGDAIENPASLLGYQPGLHEVSSIVRQEFAGQPTPEAPTPLPDIPPGCVACVAANYAPGLLKQRLVDLGLTPGATLRLVRRGPRGNLIAVSIRGATIALRSDEARSLLVTVKQP